MNREVWLNPFLKIFLLILGMVFNAQVYAEAHHSDDIRVDIEAVDLSPDEYGAIKVRFSYTNLSSSNLRLLKRGLALDGGVFEDLLEVNYKGAQLPYIGPTFRRLPAIGTDYIQLAAGETVSVTVDIHEVYDFSKLGSYEIWVKGGHKAKSERPPVTIEVSVPDLEVKRQPTFRSCDANQQASADNALTLAEIYSIRARDALLGTDEIDRATSPRYTAWFGRYEPGRWNTVQSNFNRIADGFTDKFVEFNCACDFQGIDQNSVVAYVFTNRAYEINLCPLFWQFRDAGPDSKAGVLVHEMSHFSVVADTVDHIYGIQGSLRLAQTNPANALTNASNYEYFATNARGLSIVASSSSADSNSGGFETPRPEPELEKGLTYLQSILALLLDSDSTPLVADEPSVIQGAMEPSFSEPVSRFNAVFQLSESLKTSSPSSVTWAEDYEYTELNAVFQVIALLDEQEILITSAGGGVESDDLKTEDIWEIEFGVSEGERISKGVYSLNPSNNMRSLERFDILNNVESPRCESGVLELTQVRIFDIAYVDREVHRLKMDFLFHCSNDESSTFAGAINFDKDIDLAQKKPFDANLSLLSPPLDAPQTPGLSINILQKKSSSEEPIDAWVYNSNETALVIGRSHARLIEILWSLPSENIFSWQFQRFSIRFIPPFDLLRASSETDIPIGEYDYLLGRNALPSIVGQFNFRVNEKDICTSPFSKVKVYEVEYSGREIVKSTLSFELLCQDTGEIYEGSIRLDLSEPPTL